MNEVQAAGYLGGLIDGEGHIRVKINRSVSVSNTDMDIIEAAVECCVVLALRHRISKMATRPDRKQCWEVFIVGKESLERVRDIVPIRSRRKAAALSDAIALYRTPKEIAYPPRRWLEEKYWGEGMSLAEVAELWGSKSPSHALMWMRHHGVPTRTLSESAINRRRKEAADHG
jgi:hypothetical protein